MLLKSKWTTEVLSAALILTSLYSNTASRSILSFDDLIALILSHVVQNL